MCEGDCNRQFHLECLGLTALPEGRFICIECRNGEGMHLHFDPPEKSGCFTKPGFVVSRQSSLF